MSRALELVPAGHRLALAKWLAAAGPAAVARNLTHLASYLLHYDPAGRLYGLRAPELLVLVEELTTQP